MQHIYQTNCASGKLWRHCRFFFALVILSCLAIVSKAQTVNVSTTVDVVDGNTTNIASLIGTPGGAGISLREAVIAANNEPAGASVTIVLPAGTFTLTISGAAENLAASGDLDVNAPAAGNKTITVNGVDSTSTILTSTTGERIFEIHAVNNAGSITFNLSRCRLQNAVIATGSGGAILAGRPGDATNITDCSFWNNGAINGGAISQSSGAATHSLNITTSSFMYNTGTGAGGAVNYNGLGTASITNTKFIGNSLSVAAGNGGALNLSGNGAGGTYTVSRSTFLSNRVLNASAGGGAISNVNGVATIQYNRFIGNTAASATGNTIYQSGGSAANTINANDNWWGVNTGPAANDLGAGTAPVTPPAASTWLQLRLNASPSTICSAAPGNTTTVTAGFTANSAGSAIAPVNLAALVGLPIAFSPTNGTLSGAQPTIQASGTATVVFTGTGGAGSVSAVVDNIPAGTAQVAITVTAAATISGGGQPADQNLCNTTTATFTVTASGAGLTYQWYKGVTPLSNGPSGTGSTYSGVTTATLTITNADADDNANNYNVIVTGTCGSVTSSNASLVVATAPTITPPTVTQPGCGVTTGTIVVNATGTGTLEYSVNNGGSWQTSNTFTGLTPGNYNIRVRSQSAAFCEAVYVSNPVVINAGSVAPTVNAPTLTQPTCAVPTGTIVVNATGGSGTLEYSVDNGGNWQLSNTFPGLTPGNYNIIVRNQSSPSCFTAYSSNPVVINAVPVGPTVSAPTVTQPTCAVPTGTIVVNASGSGTLEYSVNNGTNWQASNTFTGLTPGNYTVLVRLQASPTCVTAYASNPVVIDAVPVAPTVNAPTVTQPTCAAPSGTIVVNATGAGVLEYSIDAGGSWQTSNTFTGLTPGNYNIRVRLQSSPTCFTDYVGNPVVINPSPLPTVTNPGNQVACHNSSTAAITFTGSTVPATTYNWTNNNTSIGLGANGTDVIPSFTAINAGTAPVIATITVTPTAGACTGSPQTFTITVNPSPTVNAVSNQTLCATQSTTAITFSGSVPGTVYSWTNNNTSIGLGANGTGNIAAFPTVNAGPGQQVATITVTPSYTNAGQTCTGTPVTFTITVNPRPAVAVGPNGVCGPILLTATGADTYTWSPATGLSGTTGTSVTASPTSTTTYTVTGTVTATGCQNTATVQVLGTPPPIVITPSAPAICLGQFVAINAGGTSTVTFTSTNGNVIIPGSGTGGSAGSPASIYPIIIPVSGLPAGATVKSITVNGVSHSFSDDIDMLAQSPTGTNVTLMSDVGGLNVLNNHSYTFDDAAAAAMSDGGANASGTYRPTNIGTGDGFPAPGPGTINQTTPALSLFTGNFNGNWNLFVADDAGGDAGSMTTWSITFNLPSTIQWSPATGLFMDAAGTIPYTAGTFTNTVYASPASTATYTVTSTLGSCSASPANVTVTVNPLPTINVTPTGQCSPVTLTATGNSDTYSWSPATGLSATTGASVTATTPSTTVYTVTGTITATGCTNTASATVLGTPSPIVVSPANPTLCAGSFLPLTVPQTSTVTVSSAPGVINIPATGTSGVAGPYPSVINVSGLPTSGVIVKSVTINGVTHTFPDDLDILLQSPTGTNVVLMSDAGGGDDITNRNYTFDDAAAATMADGAINATGTYKPTSFDTPDTWPAPGPGAITQATPALASFTGNVNGNWNLYINDDGSGDVGTINSWSITFAVSTVQWSPATGLFLDAAGTIPYTAGTFANTVYASPASTTTYNLTSTLGTCSATPTSVTVTVNPVPTVSVAPTGQCSPVTLTATGNANTYSWSPAAGLSATTGATVVANPTVNTTYTVTGTITATGCTKTATAVVNATPPAPLIAPSSATICFGGTVALSASGAGGTTFTSSGTITVPGTGTTGVGSPYPSTITVSGLPASGVTVQSVTLNGVTHTFAGDLDVLLQSPTGTNVVVMSDANGINSVNNVNYTFRDDAAAAMTTGVNPSGTYKPTNIAGGTGVEPDAWVAPGPGTVTQPNPTLSSFTGDFNGQWKLFTVDDFTLDVGSIQSWSITFSVAGVNWSPATGLYTDPAATVPYVAGTLAATVYAHPTTTTTYSATVSTPTCTSPPTNVTVTVVQPIAITTQPTAQSVCAGATANFSVAATGNAITYQWQVNTGSGFNNIPGANNASLAVANTTTAMSGYQYRVILQNGCFAVTSNTVTLTVNAVPVVAVTPLVNRICLSDTLVALSGTPAGGVWSGVGVSGNNFIPVNTSVGTYTLTYTFTNAAGCSSSATTTAKVESCPERMILLTDNAVILWPNPNGGQFNIRINSTLYNYLGMDVYNVQGQLLYKQQWSGLRFNRVIPIDLKHLTSGVYMVKFFYDDGVRTSEKTFKVIVAR